LKPSDLLQFLVLLGRVEENTIVRRFRAWVRQRIADEWK
jgi:hypothetical protein